MVLNLNKELEQLQRIKGEPKFVELVTKNMPFKIFKKISKKFDHCFIFESLDGPKELVESSIIGFDPKFTIRCKLRSLHIYNKKKEIYKIKINDPLEIIKKYFPSVKNQQYRYVGGLVGFFCYEAIRFWEKIPVKRSLEYPLCEFGWYEDGLVFDHKKNKLEYFYYDKSRIERIEKIVETYESNTNISKSSYSNLKRNINKREFEKKVNLIKKHLLDGDIFQTVLSKKITFEYDGNSLDLYEQLRKINPSPYMFYFKNKSTILLGASPEMLLRITGSHVETYPIAGSRPVSKDPETTNNFKREMESDKKEVAEHTMLVDLARNDLGKVCQFGTVVTPELMKVKRFSHIQHMVSHVVGILDNNYDIFDAFKAVFPAGTISGAPKIRAMEIISNLEPESRGPYAGAIGYFSFNRCCDFAITIRSAFINNKNGYTQSGAGIVIDSIPNKEFQETEDKSKAVLTALEELNQSLAAKCYPKKKVM
jgi:anthranilate synthase component 1